MCVSQVGNVDLSRVNFVGCPHRGDYWNLFLPALFDKDQFGGDVIDAVKDIVVVTVEQLVTVISGETGLNRLNRGFRVDVAAALGHHLSLWSADRRIGSMQLAVNIGNVDSVEVDQRQPADATTDQRFDGKTANPAETENSDRCSA